MALIAAKSEAKRFRRYRGYDYSRGAVVFATFHLEPRQPRFGRVEGGKVVYSPAGEILKRVIEKEALRTPDAQLKKWVAMPDHVHLRIYLRPGQDEPLKRLGQFVYNVKAWSRNIAKRDLGLSFAWQKNYHDWLCISREAIEAVDRYIENNPLKWSLMHGHPPPLALVEPLVAGVLPCGEWWSGAGEVALLGGKIAAVRLSRSIPVAEFAAVEARLMSAVDKGFTLAGTWISPCERAVFAALVKRGAAIIRASQDPLSMVYRPKGDEPGLFAKGRYLVLSRPAGNPGGNPAGNSGGLSPPCSRRGNPGGLSPPCSGRGNPGGLSPPCSGCSARLDQAGVSPAGFGSRQAGWHGINDALDEIAVASGGAGVYVKCVGGRIDWQWKLGDTDL
ncbi:MAG: transposase [Kiritimatiellae bacterium]|nr:transposase [Kiritimatiellia bacterium]